MLEFCTLHDWVALTKRLFQNKSVVTKVIQSGYETVHCSKDDRSQCIQNSYENCGKYFRKWVRRRNTKKGRYKSRKGNGTNEWTYLMSVPFSCTRSNLSLSKSWHACNARFGMADEDTTRLVRKYWVAKAYTSSARHQRQKHLEPSSTRYFGELEYK